MEPQLAHIAGKNRLNQTLETAYLVTDYYKALVQGKSLPKAPFPKLEEALRCNRIRDEYIQQVNYSLKKGLRMINSKLTTSQVVWTWQQLISKPAKFKTPLHD